MKIKDETIYFMSLPRFYILEKYGEKPNTVRQIVDGELAILYKARYDLKHITITNTDTNESFTRELTNISTMRFPETRVWVFSWKIWGLLRE